MARQKTAMISLPPKTASEEFLAFRISRNMQLPRLPIVQAILENTMMHFPLTSLVVLLIAAGALAQSTRPATLPATAPTTAMSMDDRLVLARPWIDRAVQESAAVDDPQQRVMLLGGLAALWAKAGDIAQFENAIADIKAVETQKGIGHNASAMYLYGGVNELIPALIRGGKKEQARRLIDELDDSEQYHLGALTRLAGALAEAGDDTAANLMVADVPAKDADAILYSVAQGQARRRDEKAVMATAGKIKNTSMTSGILFPLVMAYCDANDFAAATRVAGQVQETNRASAYSVVVNAQLKAGRFADARRTIDLVTAPDQHDRLFLSLAFQQSLAGDLEGMNATVREMSGQSQELGGVNLLARELIKRGDEAGARQLAEAIKDPKVRQRALDTLPQHLVMASAEAGDPRRAEAHLQKMPEKDRNFTLCLNVATAMRKAKDREGYQRMTKLAQAEADANKNESRRGAWYRQMAYDMALGGDAEGAVKLARLLDKPAERDGALAGVLNGCAQAGNLAEAWPLLKEMGSGNERIAAVYKVARYAVAKNQITDLSKQVDALPPVDRCHACLAIAESYVQPVVLP